MASLAESKALLDRLSQFEYECNRTNSSTDKIKVVESYPDLKRVFEYALSDYITFGISMKPVYDAMGNIPKSEWETEPYQDLWKLLDDLSARELTGRLGLKATVRFAEQLTPEQLRAFLNIIDKNLKTRTDKTLINKVFPGCIPVFEVALAEDYEPKRVRIEDGWYVSRKLDGVRCIAIIDHNGVVTLHSRSGLKFETLDRVKTAIRGMGLTKRILDGEICLAGKDGADDFQGVMKEINRKDHQIANPRYHIFDILKPEDFNSQQSNVPYEVRYAALSSLLDHHTLAISPNGECLVKVPHYKITTMGELEAHRHIAATNGWEGIMLRKNSGYQGKRTFDLLKVKDFMDGEFTVLATVNGPMRVIRFGVEVEEEMLSAVIIQYRDDTVSVGGGFTQQQRMDWYKDPMGIIGKTITVKYFRPSSNQEGGESLRFPTFKGIREA